MNRNALRIPVAIRSTGRFRAVVHTGHEYDELGNIVRHGVILRETPFGRNKITTVGFDRALTGNQTLVMVVGSGNTAPTEDNPLMASYLGKSQTYASASTTRNVTPDVNGEVWWRMTKRVTFAPGSMGNANVNVAEAGVTNVSFNSVNASSQVSARGLLVDDLGNPTTVSVDNSIEYLDIIWEYTEWIKASVTGVVSLNIDGVATDHDYEVRPYYFDNVGGSFNSHGWANAGSNQWPGWAPPGNSTYSWNAASNVFEGPLVDIVGNGLGNGIRNNLPIMSSAAYVTGSKQRGFSCTWLPTYANLVGGIGVVRVNLGHTSWQVGYDPKLLKVNTKQLDLQFMLSMSNR